MNYLDKRRKIGQNLQLYHYFIENPSKDSLCEESATSFIDIEESAIKIGMELMPKLYKKELTKDEIEDLVTDIGEELRHILYHIKEMKIYDYL